jgi:hypothetical protein
MGASGFSRKACANLLDRHGWELKPTVKRKSITYNIFMQIQDTEGAVSGATFASTLAFFLVGLAAIHGNIVVQPSSTLLSRVLKSRGYKENITLITL